MIQRRSKRRDLAKQKHTHTNENERIAREREKKTNYNELYGTQDIEYSLLFKRLPKPNTQ